MNYRRLGCLRMLGLALAGLLCAGLHVNAAAQVCAVPGLSGPNAALSGVVNTYYPGATGSTGTSTVNIGPARAGGSATPIAVGDMVLIMQMQGADLSSTDTAQYGDGLGAANIRFDKTVSNPPTLPSPSPTVAYAAASNSTDGYAGGNLAGGSFVAGLYEYAVVTQIVSATQFSVRGGGTAGALRNTYTQAAGPNQRTFQVIRVPQYASASITGTLLAPVWDGGSGGVVALDVAGQLNLSAGINVSQSGFRGGGVRNIAALTAPQFGGYAAAYATNLGGIKGEGIAGTPARVYDSLSASLTALGATDGYVGGDVGRGAPGNAGGGGNQHNAGGGGGGNGGAGGNGGGSWNANTNELSGFETGGFGGFPVGAQSGATRLYLGGGGGAGDVGGNGSADPDGSGANGGGIIVLRSGSITGAGVLAANGGNAPNTASTDAAGGGGSGGTILVSVQTGGVGALTFQANGGAGGSNFMGATNPEQDGPGGGGGGGVVYTPSGALGAVASGISGTVSTANTTPTNAPFYYARDGAAGAQPVVGSPLDGVGVRAGFECLPALTVNKIASPQILSLATGATVTYSINVRNAALSGGATNVTIFDETLPPGWSLAAAPTITYSAAPGTSTAALGAGAELVATVAGALPNNAATALATTFPLGAAGSAPGSSPTSGSNSLRWSSFFIDQGGSLTVTFVASIPDTATVGTYHNPAGISYLDPTRLSSAPNRLITPASASNANRNATSYSTNTAHANGATLAGSNYSGLEAGPSLDDVRLLADLSISKTGSTSVVAGGSANYVLTPRNNGRPIAAQNFAASQASTVLSANVPALLGANPISITDTLTTGLTLYGTPTGANWTCTGAAGTTGTFTCDYFAATPASAFPLAGATDLPAITVPVRFNNTACPGPVSNTATVSVTPLEALTSNNTSNAVASSVSCNATLTVAKTDGATSVAAGSSTSYTLTFTNSAGASADGAVARDVPSAGLAGCSVTSCTASGGSPAAVCPAAASWPGLFTAGGLALTPFAVSSSYQFTVQCNITATGQ